MREFFLLLVMTNLWFRKFYHGCENITVVEILSRLREYHGCENFITVARISRLRVFYFCLSVFQSNHTNQFLG